MPTVGVTKFNWAQGDNGRLSENWSPGRAEVLADINVRSATQENRYQAARDLLGFNTLTTTVIAGKTWTYVTRSLPYAYPAPSLGSSPLFAASLAGGFPLGVGGYNVAGGNDYDQYRYTMGFSPREYQVKSDGEVLGGVGSPVNIFPDEGDCLRRGWLKTRFITRRVIPEERGISIPQGYLGFQGTNDGSGNPIPLRDLSWPFPEASAVVEYTWHLVPLFVQDGDKVLTGIPFNTIFKAMGKVNASSPADGLNNFDLFPSGTLLFTSMSYSAEPGPLGDLLATVIYRFSFRPKQSKTGGYTGHNGALFIVPASDPVVANRGKIDYRLVVSVADGTTLPFASNYPEIGSPPVDFGALFRPDPPP